MKMRWGVDDFESRLSTLASDANLRTQKKAPMFYKAVIFGIFAVILFYLSMWVDSWGTMLNEFIHFIVRPIMTWIFGVAAAIMVFYSCGYIYLIFRKIYIERRDNKMLDQLHDEEEEESERIKP